LALVFFIGFVLEQAVSTKTTKSITFFKRIPTTYSKKGELILDIVPTLASNLRKKTY
jgi:hypothetical protein